jgi:Tfp pilus assembly protein PilN
MLGIDRTSSRAARSFLPEDYLQKRAERRTNLLALSLFSVVTIGVIGAFLVTNRQWHDVKHYQEAINVRYAQAAKDIEQLKQLEEQKAQLLQKAELTTALIERVPRSVLLAELINRLPTDVTLLELEARSTRLAEPPPPQAPDKGRQPMKTDKSGRAVRAGAAETRPEIAPPRFLTKLAIIGVTTTHNSVADYVSNLQTCALLSAVELKFSEKTIIENREMNRFRIEAELRPEADVRRISPLASPRNPAPQTAGVSTEAQP